MTCRALRTAATVLGAGLLVLAACASPSAGFASSPRPGVPADTTGLYDIAVVEVKPQLANRSTVSRALEDNYPRELRDAGVRGTVTLRFIVEKDGRTSNIRVLRSESGAFNAPAIAVVRTMRFTPGMVANAPVRTEVALPVTFASR